MRGARPTPVPAASVRPAGWERAGPLPRARTALGVSAMKPPVDALRLPDANAFMQSPRRVNIKQALMRQPGPGRHRPSPAHAWGGQRGERCKRRSLDIIFNVENALITVSISLQLIWRVFLAVFPRLLLSRDSRWRQKERKSGAQKRDSAVKNNSQVTGEHREALERWFTRPD